MNLSGLRDTDRLILSAVPDDETLLNLMKTNKFLLKEGERIFENRMKNAYPMLASKKPPLEKWSRYYLRNMYYINLIKEKYDIPYIPVNSFVPQQIWESLENDMAKHNHLEEARVMKWILIYRRKLLLKLYAELGDLEKFKENIFTSRMLPDYGAITAAASFAIAGGNLNVLEYIIQWAEVYMVPGAPDNSFLDYIKDLILLASKHENVDIFIYLFSKYEAYQYPLYTQIFVLKDLSKLDVNIKMAAFIEELKRKYKPIEKQRAYILNFIM